MEEDLAVIPFSLFDFNSAWLDEEKSVQICIVLLPSGNEPRFA
jgi:hypothetical protein